MIFAGNALQFDGFTLGMAVARVAIAIKSFSHNEHCRLLPRALAVRCMGNGAIIHAARGQPITQHGIVLISGV